MRTYFTKMTATVLVLASALASACSGDEEKTITPNFENQSDATATLAAGESTTFTIKPNDKWMLKIPASQAGSQFWIDDNGQKAYTLRGAANIEQEVTICTSEDVQFDNTYTCPVMLTIGSTEQQIGTLTLTPTERTFALYTCVIGEDGLFSYYSGDENPHPTYDYEATAAEGINLVWPVGQAGFSMPIKVEANFDWNLTGYPDWVAFSEQTPTTGEANTYVEIHVTSDATKYPLNGATDALVFTDKLNSEKTFRMPITIPACADMLEITGIAENLQFDADGMTTLLGMPGSYARGYINSTEGAVFYVAVPTNNGEDYYTSGEKVAWVTITENPWDTDDASVLQERTFKVEAAANTGDERIAKLLALPKSVAATLNGDSDNLLNGSYSDIKEEYKKYIFATLTQSPSEGGGGLAFEGDTYGYAEVKELTSGDDYDKWAEYGVPVYELIHHASWAGGSFMMTSPVFGSYYAQASDSTAPASWLSVESYDPGKLYIFMNPASGEESTPLKGVIIFYTDTMMMSPAFIVVCKYDPTM